MRGNFLCASVSAGRMRHRIWCWQGEVAVAGHDRLFRYRVIQLNRLDYRNYVNKLNPVAVALMTKMNVAPSDFARVRLECVSLLARLKLDPARQRLISQFIDEYLELTTEQLE